MAEALNITDQTWSGFAASFFITRSVVSLDTVQKGAIYVQDGIKKQFTIPRIEVSNFIQKRAATPLSQGVVGIDGKVLVPQDLMLYYEFNPRDFEQHFYAEQLSPTLLGRELPVTANNFMVMQTMARLNEFFENLIWKSRKSYDPALGAATVAPASKNAPASDAQYLYLDGLMTKALNDPTVIQTPSPAVLTVTNIRPTFQKMLNLVPKALLYKYGSKGLKFLVGYPTQLVYEQALREDTFKNENTTEAGINKYSNYDVVPCAGIPDNTIFVCIAKPDNASNLWLGLNSGQDDDQLQLARLQANSEMFFVKGLFKMDTQIGFGDQLVIHTLITA